MVRIPQVTVVMPLFNSELTVATSIGSVLNQTFSDFELLVVNDASTDRSSDIVSNICASDPRVRLINCETNVGAGGARNLALSQARGRYIAFLDADDLWLPEKLKVQIDELNNGAFFVCSWYRIEDLLGNEKGVRHPQQLIKYEDLLFENVIGCLTVIYDRQKLGDRRMSDIRKRQDYALWLELLKEVDCTCVQQELAIYRDVPNSISKNKIEMIKFNYKMFRKCERLGVFASSYYVLRNIFRKCSRVKF